MSSGSDTKSQDSGCLTAIIGYFVICPIFAYSVVDAMGETEWWGWLGGVLFLLAGGISYAAGAIAVLIISRSKARGASKVVMTIAVGVVMIATVMTTRHSVAERQRRVLAEFDKQQRQEIAMEEEKKRRENIIYTEEWHCRFGEGTLVFRQEGICAAIARTMASNDESWIKLVNKAPASEMVRLGKGAKMTGICRYRYEVEGYAIMRIDLDYPYTWEYGGDSNVVWVYNNGVICNGRCRGVR